MVIILFFLWQVKKVFFAGQKQLKKCKNYHFLRLIYFYIDYLASVNLMFFENNKARPLHRWLCAGYAAIRK